MIWFTVCFPVIVSNDISFWSLLRSEYFSHKLSRYLIKKEGKKRDDFSDDQENKNEVRLCEDWQRSSPNDVLNMVIGIVLDVIFSTNLCRKSTHFINIVYQ